MNDEPKYEEKSKAFTNFAMVGYDLTDREKQLVRDTVASIRAWMLTQGTLYIRSELSESTERNYATGESMWSLRFRAAFSDFEEIGEMHAFDKDTGVRLIKLIE